MTENLIDALLDLGYSQGMVHSSAARSPILHHHMVAPQAEAHISLAIDRVGKAASSNAFNSENIFRVI